MSDQPEGRGYFKARAIYRLTQRAVQAVHEIVSKGPLSPLTGMQSLTLRVALADVVRESIKVGEWLSRAKAGSKEPPPLPRSRPKSQTVILSPSALAPEDPKFDEDVTTEPMALKR